MANFGPSHKFKRGAMRSGLVRKSAHVESKDKSAKAAKEEATRDTVGSKTCRKRSRDVATADPGIWVPAAGSDWTVTGREPLLGSRYGHLASAIDGLLHNDFCAQLLTLSRPGQCDRIVVEFPTQLDNVTSTARYRLCDGNAPMSDAKLYLHRLMIALEKPATADAMFEADARNKYVEAKAAGAEILAGRGECVDGWRRADKATRREYEARAAEFLAFYKARMAQLELQFSAIAA